MNDKQYKNESITLPEQYCTKKSIELYVFIDPLCRNCWDFSTILKKFHLEYGQYFSSTYIPVNRYYTTKKLLEKRPSQLAFVWEKTASRSDILCDDHLWIDNKELYPYYSAIALKAAELQGRVAGVNYLKKLQEYYFLKDLDITDQDVLIECAKDINIDVKEFMEDLHSTHSIKALQCDIKVTKEMHVTEIPSVVFFNENIEEEGLKVSGFESYQTYVKILELMTNTKLEKRELPDLAEFIKFQPFVTIKELCMIYEQSTQCMELELKKLILRRKVKKIVQKDQIYYQYVV
ncbi:DsbA family protein [Bacillus sp. AFS088145]|uniref:DsbA family protein n=1 Tax=Bacillus sp. AFS088145 TaxID=2033514 RepID=UPI000BF2724F|nr:DsbA family protein [Bacillus sp. AFS088145]PFH87833.1 dithiol-disulfide isomerase [Bacillus sp. AFS088145]